RRPPRSGERSLAGRQGFAPRYRGPEPRVLPLDDLPVSVEAIRSGENFRLYPFRHQRQASDQEGEGDNRRLAATRRAWTRALPSKASTSKRPGLADLPVTATRAAWMSEAAFTPRASATARSAASVDAGSKVSSAVSAASSAAR